jgi:hypothetical protein
LGLHARAEAAVNVRRILVWAFFAVVILYVVQSPDHAAEVVRDAGGGLFSAASSFASFLGSLI